MSNMRLIQLAVIIRKVLWDRKTYYPPSHISSSLRLFRFSSSPVHSFYWSLIHSGFFSEFVGGFPCQLNVDLRVTWSVVFPREYSIRWKDSFSISVRARLHYFLVWPSSVSTLWWAPPCLPPTDSPTRCSQAFKWQKWRSTSFLSFTLKRLYLLLFPKY